MSVDPPASSVELSRKLQLTFPLLSDVDRSVTRRYGVEDAENEIAWPAIFLIRPDGTVAWRSLAETYKVRALPAQIFEALGPPPR